MVHLMRGVLEGCASPWNSPAILPKDGDSKMTTCAGRDHAAWAAMRVSESRDKLDSSSLE